MAESLSSADEDLELLRASAVTAGIIATGYFRRDIKSWTKGHDSPVSEADILVDQFLASALMAARPDYGWLSEESADDLTRLERRRVFVIDPIDGTRGFLRGEDSWCVSVAVVEDGRPLAGVIYAPIRDELYAASRDGGTRLNGRPLLRKHPSGRSLPLIPLPGAVHTALDEAGFAHTRGPHYPSLAYRLVQVAAGRLDAAVARRGSNDWDVAAAAIVLSETGITLEDVCEETLAFNRPDVRHGALCATAELSLKPQLHEALRRVYGCPPPEQRTP